MDIVNQKLILSQLLEILVRLKNAVEARVSVKVVGILNKYLKVKFVKIVQKMDINVILVWLNL